MVMKTTSYTFKLEFKYKELVINVLNRANFLLNNDLIMHIVDECMYRYVARSFIKS
jgi:hypothetical protein